VAGRYGKHLGIRTIGLENIVRNAHGTNVTLSWHRLRTQCATPTLRSATQSREIEPFDFLQRQGSAIHVLSGFCPKAEEIAKDLSLPKFEIMIIRKTFDGKSS
jgi:hypothetical protein